MAEKNRPLYILKYLLDNTDEDHPAIINDILAHLEERGIHAARKTVAADLTELQDSGFDVICNKSRQNKYFIGTRSLELAELKMIVDAIQAAKFISPTKSLALIDKLSSLASPYQAAELKRKLYVEGKAKTTNESVYYTVDLLHHAINHENTVEFQYIRYAERPIADAHGRPTERKRSYGGASAALTTARSTATTRRALRKASCRKPS